MSETKFDRIVFIARNVKESLEQSKRPYDAALSELATFVLECAERMPKSAASEQAILEMARRGLLQTIEAVPADPPPRTGAWRSGRKTGRTLYFNENLVGMLDNPAIAKRIVDAMNGEYAVIRNGTLDNAAEVCERVGTFDPDDVNFTALKCKKRILDLKT